MRIYGKYLPTGKIEKLDNAEDEREANYLISEYQLAFGEEWIIWSGTRKDCPGEKAA